MTNLSSPSFTTFFQDITNIEGVSSLFAQVAGGTSSPFLWEEGVSENKRERNTDEFKQLFLAATAIITSNNGDELDDEKRVILDEIIGVNYNNGGCIKETRPPQQPLLFINQLYRTVALTPISLHAIGPRRSSIFVYKGKIEMVIVTSYPSQPNVVLPKVERFLKERNL